MPTESELKARIAQLEAENTRIKEAARRVYTAWTYDRSSMALHNAVKDLRNLLDEPPASVAPEPLTVGMRCEWEDESGNRWPAKISYVIKPFEEVYSEETRNGSKRHFHWWRDKSEWGSGCMRLVFPKTQRPAPGVDDEVK